MLQFIRLQQLKYIGVVLTAITISLCTFPVVSLPRTTSGEGGRPRLGLNFLSALTRL